MRAPFVWGENDCAIGLAARCVQAITGEDMAAPFRGTYDTAEGAIAALNDAGFADLVAFALAHFEEIHPSQARIGDLALIPSEPTGWTVGVFAGERIGVLTLKGYGTVERERASRAFRVG